MVQAYVPAIHGKEKRKPQPGKEGLLGVEGVDDAIVVKILREALGAEADAAAPARRDGRSPIPTCTIGAFPARQAARSGKQSSSTRWACRRASKKELVEALNRLYSFEQLNSMQETLFKDEE